MANPTPQDERPVSQEAREAAAELYRELQNGDQIPTSLHDAATMAEICMGKHDDWPEVQALAAAEQRGAEKERAAIVKHTRSYSNYPCGEGMIISAMRASADCFADKFERGDHLTQMENANDQ